MQFPWPTHPTVPVLAKSKTATGRLWGYVRDDRPFGARLHLLDQYRDAWDDRLLRVGDRPGNAARRALRGNDRGHQDPNAERAETPDRSLHGAHPR